MPSHAYAAFIRGIMPMNPNMRNEKLRGVFEELGFTEVRSVISSGNIIFRSTGRSQSGPRLEAMIEKALSARLGVTGAVMVRSARELDELIRKDPFKGSSHSRETYLIVTFMKAAPREAFNVIDISSAKAPDFMTALEKRHGKKVTTRTWKTVLKIVEKMGS